MDKRENKIFEVSPSTKETQIKDARNMEEVNKSTKSINEKFEEMKEDGMIKERQISELENEVKTLNEKLETMYKSLDRHEKYSMIIHAMKENKNQNTDEVIIKIFEKKK